MLPRSDNRTTIIGSTGSGKTSLALWLLGTRDIERRPWLIIDYKRDVHIGELDAKEIKFSDKLPTAPGLYVIRPIIEYSDGSMARLFQAIWKQENYGLFADEGMSLPKSVWLNSLYTQGRSKNIEFVTLIQRPRFLPNKFIISEADKIMAMKLNLSDDQNYVAEFTGGRYPRLVPHLSYWYSQDDQRGQLVKPVCPPWESVDKINAKVRARLMPRRMAV